METWPPHLYRDLGSEHGIPAEVIDAALAQAHKVQVNGLPAVLSLRHFAALTQSSYEYLRSVISREHDPYRVFRIGKKKGGFRTIVAPQPPLRRAQRWISDYILAALSAYAHPASFAYAPGSSIVRCAEKHAGARWLVKIDLHRFFESISEIDAYRVFLSGGYQPLVSFELARLCTRVTPSTRQPWQRWKAGADRYSIRNYRHFRLGFVPQGAPSSPMLANLVAVRLDRQLERAASDSGLVYTRYSDDLVFSTASRSFTRDDARRFVDEVYRALRPLGFRPNLTKTTIVPPGARKIVLGLLVDSRRPRLSRQFRDGIDTHLFHLRSKGASAHAAHREFDSVIGMLRHVRGLLDFAYMVEPYYGREALATLQRVLAEQGLSETY